MVFYLLCYSQTNLVIPVHFQYLTPSSVQQINIIFCYQATLACLPWFRIIKNENVLPLLSGLFISLNCLNERDQKVHIQPKRFPFSGIKTYQIVNLRHKKPGKCFNNVEALGLLS